ncbi:MAG: hypothetical protein ACK5LM_05790 [Lactovum sp.]
MLRLQLENLNPEEGLNESIYDEIEASHQKQEVIYTRLVAENIALDNLGVEDLTFFFFIVCKITFF